MTVLGMPEGSTGVIGGAKVFGLFLDRYDVFYLSRAGCAPAGWETGISRSTGANARTSARTPRA